MLTVGSLFAGIGGIDLAFEAAGFRIAWQVEIDDFCTDILSKRWPDVPRYRDVRECGAHNLARCDVLTGGFPCQDISVAGQGAGILAGTRSGLWFEFARIIGELRPDSCSWRTSQLSLLATEQSYLARLPRWGMTRGGVLYQRRTPGPVTSANGGGAWPSPNIRDHHSQGAGMNPKARSVALSTRVEKMGANWPTPTGDDANNVTRQSGAFQSLTRAVWATPAARDWRSGKASDETMERNSRPLNEQVEMMWPTPRAGSDTMVGDTNHWKALQKTDLKDGRNALNPDWVEALMGYPPGWTNPTAAYTSRDLGSFSTSGSRRESPAGNQDGSTD